MQKNFSKPNATSSTPTPIKKAAAPKGAATNDSKKFFEQQIRLQKPEAKNKFMAAKFERRIDKEEKGATAMKTKAPQPGRPVHALGKKFEKDAINSGNADKLKTTFESKTKANAPPPAKPAGNVQKKFEVAEPEHEPEHEATHETTHEAAHEEHIEAAQELTEEYQEELPQEQTEEYQEEQPQEQTEEYQEEQPQEE